jgi:tetratricopeptide (TPR) repeat protein
MPIAKYSSIVARNNIENNVYAKWPQRGDEDNRIEPITTPGIAPKFQLMPSSSIFTIGSCFARNIERALVERGFTVPTKSNWAEGFDRFNLDNVMLNNYGVPSIYNTLNWALEPDGYNLAQHFLEVYPGKYCDLDMPRSIPIDSLEVVTARREKVLNLTRSIKHCDLLVLTLGLVEVWWDIQSQSYLNMRPPSVLIGAHQGRFELHVLSFEDVISDLRKIALLLNRHCPKIKVIISVSPVPLNATYTHDDVCVANTYSKSVLRTAAATICAENERFDYFPSYESIMLSDRQLAWERDLIHPTRDIIDRNVNAMITHYAGVQPSISIKIPEHQNIPHQTPVVEEKMLQDALTQFKAGNHQQVIEMIGQLQGMHNIAYAAFIKGQSQLKLGYNKAALETFGFALEKVPNAGNCIGGYASALALIDRIPEAIEYYHKALNFAPDSVKFQLCLANLYCKSGSYEKALPYINSAELLKPTSKMLKNVRAQYERGLIHTKANTAAK